jgi:hypothetical protein
MISLTKIFTGHFMSEMLVKWIGDMLMKKRLSPEDKAKAETAQSLVGQGKYAEAFELLKALPFGLGFNDEAMRMGDLVALGESGLLGLDDAEAARKLEALVSFINDSLRNEERWAFGRVMTAEEDPTKRVIILAALANLPNNEARKAHLNASGVFAPSLLKRAWDKVNETNPDLERETDKILVRARDIENKIRTERRSIWTRFWRGLTSPF